MRVTFIPNPFYPWKGVEMPRRPFGRSRLAALLASVALIGGTFIAASPSALAVTKYCSWFQGNLPVGSCIWYQWGAVNAEGINTIGHGYCIKKAHEEETYPGGYFNTPDHLNWCGVPTIQMGAWAGHGQYCGILWGNNLDGRGWFKVGDVCHNY